MLYREEAQKSHDEHGMPTSRATRSPGRSLEEGGEETTMPDDSWPRVKGSRTRMSPLRL